MKPILPLLVLADDLTGALDTGVKFSKKKILTLVVTAKDFARNDYSNHNFSVLVIDTETRHLIPEDASQIVRETISKVQSRYDINNYYKKTDSTLRGNIGSELEAVIYATGRNTLLFIPAYPSMNRTTYRGNQLINGKSISKTDFARDILEPISDSFIPDIIHQQSNIQVEIVSYKNINFDKLHQTLSIKEKNSKPKIYVFDAETNEHLSYIAHYLNSFSFPLIIAGCGGFAEYLSNLFYLQKQETKYLKCSTDILLVNGSVNQLSIDQINYAFQSGISMIKLTTTDLLQRCISTSVWYKNTVNKLYKSIKTDKNIIITTVESKKEVILFKNICDSRKRCFMIISNLGILVREIMEHCQWRKTLVVFGGDTAIGIFNHLNAVGIIPKHEIVPGVILSEVIKKEYRVCFITKAGGFGNTDVISTIKYFLQEVH